MSKGKWLSSEEEAIIHALVRANNGVSEIARNIRRSTKAVRNYLKRKKVMLFERKAESGRF